MTYATYQTSPEVHGHGMFFFTDCCGNRMYAVDNDAMVYHGKLCPGCMWKGKQVTVYLRGTDEANEVMRKRGVIKNDIRREDEKHDNGRTC